MYLDAHVIDKKLWISERNAEGVRSVKQTNPPYVFYYEDASGSYRAIHDDNVKLKRSFHTKYFDMKTAIQKRRSDHIQCYETDVNPVHRYLEEKYPNDDEIPPMHVSFIDIEVAQVEGMGYDGSRPDNALGEVTAITLYNVWEKLAYTIATCPPGMTMEETRSLLDDASNEDGFGALSEEEGYYLCTSERELLQTFLDLIQSSDVLSGWNSEFYDLPYLINRIRVLFGEEDPLRIARETGDNVNPMKVSDEAQVHLERFNLFPTLPTLRIKDQYGKMVQTYRLHGRVHLDYMLLFQKFTKATLGELHSYALDYVLNTVVQQSKVAYDGTLDDLREHNFRRFLAYNRQDTMGLGAIEEKLTIMDQANTMAHMAGVTLDNVLGSVVIIEQAILRRLHKQGRISFDKPRNDEGDKIPGAFVVDPQAGMHEWIVSFDIASLYPSIIRMLNISPETLVGQFLTPATDKLIKDFMKDDPDLSTSAWAQVTGVLEYHEIIDGSSKTYSFQYAAGHIEERTGPEWKQWLIVNNYGISANATVFDMNRKGIVAECIDDWFHERIKSKKKASEFEKKLGLLMKETKTEDLVPSEIHELNKSVVKWNTIQTVQKTFLNSTYGALLNRFFRFNDVRLGKSVTLSGRVVTKHMIKKTAEVITENYEFDRNAIIYGDSVVGNSEVVIEGGKRVPIESLFSTVRDTHGEKEYDFPDTKVLTYDPILRKSVYRPIKYIMRHKSGKKVFRVWSNNSTYIDVTEDHSLMGYVNTNNRRADESFMIKVKPEELGDRVNSLIHLKTVPYEVTSSRGYSKEVYELLGNVVGDGHAEKKTNGGIRVSVGAQDITEISRKLFDPLVEQGLITSYAVRRNGHDVTLCGTKIYHLVRDALYRNGTKEVPQWLFGETPENIAAFLRGYFSADGTVARGVIRLTSVVEENLIRVKNLLFQCGIASTYFTETKPNFYEGVCSNTFSRHLVVRSTEEFRDRVGFLLERNQKRIMDRNKCIRVNTEEHDFELIKVSMVEEIPFNDYVYDIEMEDTHTFFANNILVHNTDSVYASLDWYIKKNKFDASNFATFSKKIIKLSDEMGDQINSSFYDFVRSNFLVDDHRSKAIEAVRDVVAPRGLFKEGKKRYALWVINSEGKPKDEIKIMGMETRRSDTPKVLQKFIETCMEKVLKENAQYPEMYAFVQEYRKTVYRKSELWNRGSPQRIKNLTGKTRELATYESALERGLTMAKKPLVHFSLMAAMNTNALIKLNEETRWDQFRDGDKIEIISLKKNEYGFKTVAIRSGETYIPDWFRALPFDNKAMEEKMFDKKLYNTLGVILEWDFTAEDNHAEVVFEKEDFFS